jgi:hypothetical protein
MSESNTVFHAAVVSRRELDPRAPDRYLQLSTEGPPRWTLDPEAATTFVSMREAARAAARLPASLCAFSVPLDIELLNARDLH